MSVYSGPKGASIPGGEGGEVAGQPYPFAFGSATLPGLAKLAEECGEVGQVIGKLMMTGGRPEHWDGSDLMDRLSDEIADVQAAIDFFRRHNGVDFPSFVARVEQKRALFEQWHDEQAQTPATPTAGNEGASLSKPK